MQAVQSNNMQGRSSAIEYDGLGRVGSEKWTRGQLPWMCFHVELTCFDGQFLCRV